jgi:predicted HD phosphohydrolase
MTHVSFTRMDQGTPEDFALLAALEERERPGIASQVLGLLQGLASADSGYQIDRLTHSLQTATRASRDGADEETIVCALLHDIGDLHAPDNHAAFAASILAPYVSERNAWIVQHHGVFQGYYFFHHLGGDRHERERFRQHPWFDDCAAFCEDWDQVSFDPHYETLALENFVPMVNRVLARQPWTQEG